MKEVDELKLKLMLKQAVREEMDEFYKRFAILLEQVSSSKMSPTLQRILDLLEGEELTAEEIAKKRNTSRAAAVQACSKLYSLGLAQKVRKGKKVYYKLA